MLQKLKQMTCIFLAGVMLFSGCSNPVEKVPQSTATAVPLYEWGKVKGKTITVWAEGANYNLPYMASAFERYEALTGNTINMVSFSKKELVDKLQKTYVEGGTERPDVLLSASDATLEGLNLNENFYDFTTAPWIDDLTDMAINQAIYGGKVVGFPYTLAAISGTLYNKKLFAKYNLTVPTTQTEFLQVCETLLQNGVTPVYLPYAEITMLLYQFPMSTFLEGSKTLTALNDGTLTYAQIPEMKKIVEWYKIMGDNGYFGTDYLKNDWAGMDGAMKSEQYGMMLCWDTWLYEVFSGNAADFGLMPAFMGTPDNGCFEGPNLLLLMADKKGQNQDAALDFITFCADPYNYNVAFAGNYTAPVYKKQTVNTATPQYIEAERLVEKLFVNSIARSRVKGFTQLDAEYIQNYMQGKCTVDECLQDMDRARMTRAGIVAPTAPDELEETK